MKNFILGVVALLLMACAPAGPEADPEYRAEIEAWRAARLERLVSEDGWLTLVGLYWLDEGVNRLGSNPENEVVLGAAGVPPLAGTIEVTGDGGVVARATADAEMTVNGDPLVEAMIATDADGTPDMLGLDRFRFHVIERGGRLAVRVKDRNAPARTAFGGIDHFPIDEAFRVSARLEPYETLREVQIPTVVGTPATMLAPGVLHFTVGGSEHSLEPYLDSPEDESYFLIFRDRTSGESSYGAGRFLSAEAVDDEATTVLDFNLAYNPPCAYTPYATCPLAPPQNALAVPIEAGEKYTGTVH